MRRRGPRPGALLILALACATACLERGRADETPRVAPGPGAHDELAGGIDSWLELDSWPFELLSARLAARAPGRTPEPGTTRHADASITLALAAEPAHLDPLAGGDGLIHRLTVGDVFEGLVCRRGQALVPCLARTIEVSADGRTWTFALRSGVRWHDGAPLTAADVIFSLRAARDSGTWLAAELEGLEAIEPVGDEAVQCRFARARIDRRAALARVPILPAHLHDQRSPAAGAARRAPVGTGPLRFVSWPAGGELVLARSDDYWDERVQAPRRVTYRPVTGTAHALRLLAAGEIDLVGAVPLDEARALAADPALVAYAHREPAYLAAVHNHARAPLGDVRARRALTTTMDRRALARELFGGWAQVLSGPHVVDERDPTVAPLPFAPDQAARARELFDDRVLEVLVPAESRQMGRLADIWAQDARRLVTMRVIRQPYARVLERVRTGDFDIALLGFTTGEELDLFPLFHSSQIGAGNWSRTRDAALDAALEAVRGELDPARRRALHRVVHRRLHELQPFTFIVDDVRVGVTRRALAWPRAGARAPRAHELEVWR